MTRLTKNEKAAYREELAEKQGGLCKLCEQPLGDDKSLDHCHTDGNCRAVLHRWCNAQLGRVENAARRVGRADHITFLENCVELLRDDHSHKPYHPTHKNDIEKQIAKIKKRMAKCKTKRGKQKNKDLINRLKEQL